MREWFSDFEIERCEASKNFSPGAMLGFLAANLLHIVSQSGAPEEEQKSIADTTLRQWADFWARTTEPPKGFSTLEGLPQDLQKRLAAGIRADREKAGRSRRVEVGHSETLPGAGKRIRLDHAVRRRIESIHRSRETRSFRRNFISGSTSRWIGAESVRWLRISGWCVTKSGQPLTAIRARLHGRTFEGRFDRERPEVAAYTGVANAPRWCGFTLDIEVPFGKGRLEVQVAGPRDPWQKFFAADVRGPLFPDATERQQHLERTLAEAPGRYHFWFDRPARWDEPASTLYIIGWCVDRRGGWIHGIRARIGSQEIRGQIWYSPNGYSADAPGPAGGCPQRFRPGRPRAKRESRKFFSN